MGDAPGPVDIVLPSGERARTSLSETSDGVWRTEYLAETFGLYRFANGELTTLTHVGPANPKEYAEIVSTEAKLSPVVKQTRGATFRTSRSPTLSDLPRIVPVSGSGNASGSDWMGIRETSASRLIGVRQVSLFSGLLGLAVLLLTLGALWAREGR